MPEYCRNCGHEDWEHSHNGRCYWRGFTDEDIWERCACPRFRAVKRLPGFRGFLAAVKTIRAAATVRLSQPATAEGQNGSESSEDR